MQDEGFEELQSRLSIFVSIPRVHLCQASVLGNLRGQNISGNVSFLKLKDRRPKTNDFVLPPNNKVFHPLSIELLQLLLIFLCTRLLPEFLAFAISHREALGWFFRPSESPFSFSRGSATYAQGSRR